MTTNVESRDDLSRLLGVVFDSFSFHPEQMHTDDWPWPVNYTRQMLALLVKSGTVTTVEDGEGETYWQCWKTYDEHEFAEVLGDFDHWFDNHATSIEGESMATTAPPKVKPEANTPCYCGCGELSKGFYRPGHDARHAGNVGRLVAQNTLAGESDPEQPYNDLPSEKLVAKAKKITESALAKASKSVKKDDRKVEAHSPGAVAGIVKVGKNEYAAQRLADGSVTYWKGNEELTASKTAAKTFQVG